MAKRIKFSDPETTRWVEAGLALAKRQMCYQRLLWSRLKAIAPIRKRDQSDPWGSNYVALLERAARHQRRMERSKERFLTRLLTFSPTRRKAILKLVSIDGQRTPP